VLGGCDLTGGGARARARAANGVIGPGRELGERGDAAGGGSGTPPLRGRTAPAGSSAARIGSGAEARGRGHRRGRRYVIVPAPRLLSSLPCSVRSESACCFHGALRPPPLLDRTRWSIWGIALHAGGGCGGVRAFTALLRFCRR
jgi:hypothetical protein